MEQQAKANGGLVDFHDLEPGLYHVATPRDIEVVMEEVNLREADHFWIDKKRQQVRGEWQDVILGLRTSTDGLRIQAEALGVHVVSRIVEMNQKYCRAEATGYRLRPDGFLEIFRSTKEYDLTAELAKAALKKVPRNKDERPAAATSQALAKIETEAGALALVSTLPQTAQVEVLQARLEVQAHRLGLCETKAANRVLRYYIGKAGGILKAQPGFKQMKIELRHAVLMRRLDPAALRAVTDSLFAAQAPAPQPAPPTPRATEAQPGPEVERTATSDGGEATEDAEVLREEAAGEAQAMDDEQEDDGGANDETADEPGPYEQPERVDPHTGEMQAGEGQPTLGDIIPCGDCQRPLTAKEIAFCQSERGRAVFGGANWCYSCQPKHKQQGGAA